MTDERRSAARKSARRLAVALGGALASSLACAELEATRLREVTQWLERYRKLWEGNYRRLDALLETLKTREST